MTKQPFKHFDLPTIHFAAGEGYVPPRTRDSIEADRRHNNPPDTLILEHQSIGVAKLLALHDIAPDNPADRDYINENMAMALLNAAYHSSAQHADDVMRRRLDLPTLADDDADWRETRSGLYTRTRTSLMRTAELAAALELAHKKGLQTKQLAKQFGRQAGSTALQLVSVPLTDAPRGMSAGEIQTVMRYTASDTLERARQSRDKFGVPASIAQFALADSPLSTVMRQNAPNSNQAFYALEQVHEEYPVAA